MVLSHLFSKIHVCLREGFKKSFKNWMGGALFFGGGGSGKTCGGPQFYCDFGKSSLGGNLIVHLCILLCKDKAMMGYNVLGMYLRTIGMFLLAVKIYVKKSH